MILSKQNNVVDLTKEFLYSGNPDYDDFEYQLNLINHASLNVTFGIGGPLVICQAYSTNNLSYVGQLNGYRWIYDNFKNVYRDFGLFFTTLRDRILDSC